MHLDSAVEMDTPATIDQYKEQLIQMVTTTTYEGMLTWLHREGVQVSRRTLARRLVLWNAQKLQISTVKVRNEAAIEQLSTNTFADATPGIRPGSKTNAGPTLVFWILMCEMHCVEITALIGSPMSHDPTAPPIYRRDIQYSLNMLGNIPSNFDWHKTSIPFSECCILTKNNVCAGTITHKLGFRIDDKKFGAPEEFGEVYDFKFDGYFLRLRIQPNRPKHEAQKLLPLLQIAGTLPIYKNLAVVEPVTNAPERGHLETHPFQKAQNHGGQGDAGHIRRQLSNGSASREAIPRNCTGFIGGKIQTEGATLSYIPDPSNPATNPKIYWTNPLQPLPANPKTEEAIEARITELENIEKENAYRYELLKRKRNNETRQRYSDEDYAFLEVDRAIDAEEFSLRHQLKRLKKGQPLEEPNVIGRIYPPTNYQSPILPATPGQIFLQQPHMPLQNATTTKYDMLPPPLSSSSSVLINPLTSGFTPIGPPALSSHDPGTINSPRSTKSGAFKNHSHKCERLDALRRGIWTSYGPGGTEVEMYLQCSDCKRIDWSTIQAFLTHLVKVHGEPKGMTKGWRNALDNYGVPVSEIQEYERNLNTKPKS